MSASSSGKFAQIHEKHQRNERENPADEVKNVPTSSRYVRSTYRCASQTLRNGDAAINQTNNGASLQAGKESKFTIFEQVEPTGFWYDGSQTINTIKEEEKQALFGPELHAVCLLALFHVNFVCAICNEAIIDCICLECGHSFCTLCLHQWLTSNRACPTCYQFVKEDFGVQRTYCVDEFISEIYTSLQELTQEYFGTAAATDPPFPPTASATAAEIQASVRSVKVLNPTSETLRQQLKQVRRICVKERHPARERDGFSLLEQQTELLAGPDNVSLSAVVQFFLSSITAYITYEGGDSIENDFILVGAISVLVWYTTFLILMRLLGYDGTFGELVSYLQFIRFVEDPTATTNEDDGDNVTNPGRTTTNQENYSESGAGPRSFMSSMLFGNNEARTGLPDSGVRQRTRRS